MHSRLDRERAAVTLLRVTSSIRRGPEMRRSAQSPARRPAGVYLHHIRGRKKGRPG